jgi:hypothetical protein
MADLFVFLAQTVVGLSIDTGDVLGGCSFQFYLEFSLAHAFHIPEQTL